MKDSFILITYILFNAKLMKQICIKLIVNLIMVKGLFAFH